MYYKRNNEIFRVLQLDEKTSDNLEVFLTSSAIYAEIEPLENIEPISEREYVRVLENMLITLNEKLENIQTLLK